MYKKLSTISESWTFNKWLKILIIAYFCMMIVYSVTVKVELEIHNDWIDWMQKVHIPDVMNTKKFIDYKMLRVLAEDEQNGVTYNIQYRAASMSDYFDYQNDFAPKLQAEHTERYKDKFVGFRTLLKEV